MVVFQATIRGNGFWHTQEFAVPPWMLKPQELLYTFEAGDEDEARAIAENFCASSSIFNSFCMVHPELVHIQQVLDFDREAWEKTDRPFPFVEVHTREQVKA